MMNTVFKPNLPFLKNIRKVIVFCAAVVIVAISCEFFLIESLLAKREKDAFIINTAGHQRTLSQKIAKNLFAYHHDQALEKELQNDAEEWRNNHISLQAKDDHVFGRDKVQAKIDSLFEEINPFQQQLYEMAINIGGLPHIDSKKESIREWEKGFLKGMDELVNLYQAQSEKAIFRMELIVSLFSVFFIALILIMYFFLIDPIIASMRKLATEQKVQAQNMASIIENTEDLIWCIDKHYNLLIFNSTFKKHMKQECGMEPKLRQSIFKYSLKSPVEDKVWYDRALSGETFRVDWELNHNGTTTYHELSFNPIWGEDGRVSGCNVSRRNETERIETLNAVKKGKKRLKEAQGIAKLGNWNWEIAIDESEWSDELYKILGQDSETYEASVANFMSFVHPDDKERFEKNLSECLENKEPYDIVHRILLNDGSVKYLHQRGIVLSDESGKAVRMSGTTQDVTVLEQAKNEILKQYDELQNFVYIISHNVRSPISTIQSLVDLFETGEEETNKQVVEMIGQKVDVLDDTIKDLNRALSFQKVSVSSYEWVNISEILANIQELMAKDIEQNAVEIDMEITVDKVFGIKSYINNILFNLILNAINYKRDDSDPKISVSTRANCELGEVEILVSDNGLGMQLNDNRKKKIFGMYGRLDGAKTGKGLGLFLVKTQVEAMGGRINVMSELGKGSTFVVSLKHKCMAGKNPMV